MNDKDGLTIKQLFAIMPNSTKVCIFDRESFDTVYVGDILYFHGRFRDSVIAWLYVGNNELIIHIN